MDGIVPDIIDEAPSKLTVIYGDKNIEIGQELTPLEVRNQPTIVWEAKPGKYYFLAMIDPDAPSKIDQSKGQVMHWMVGNILGNDLRTGDVFTEYVGSGPPKDSGLHRYIFLVYEQKDKLQFEEQKILSNQVTGRLNFSIKKFAAKYNIGSPKFANYYEAQWDFSVDELRKTFIE